MVWVARFSGVVAAIIWLVGMPLVVMSSVPLPSDAEYFLSGAVSLALGLTLVPLAIVVGPQLTGRAQAIVRGSGLGVSIALVLSGALLVLAVDGRLGERAPRWIADSPDMALVALFAWMGIASYALRGPATIERGLFWIGLLTSGSVLVLLLFSMVPFLFASGFIWTHVPFLPLLLLVFFLWVSTPAWLLVVVGTL